MKINCAKYENMIHQSIKNAIFWRAFLVNVLYFNDKTSEPYI